MQQLLPFFHTAPDEAKTIGPRPPLKVAGLFAGIGGIEVGLHEAGHTTTLVCEIDACATAVLRERMPNTVHHSDVTTLESLPDIDLLAAGFPCQDLSIAGRRVGISGDRSSLVTHVFRLLDDSAPPPTWLLLENVPFMLRLQNGQGMRFLADELEVRGFSWAYRVFDTRAFELPHRRQRVLLLASQSEDPRNVLLSVDASEPDPLGSGKARAYGFYWTEGHRGIGWSEESVPPIKVGSSLGIPSSPAVWDPNTHSIFKLDIRDVERLQGFPSDWTKPAERVGKRSDRWRLVGNSVSVPLGEWLGARLRHPTLYDYSGDWPVADEAPWPQAAWGNSGKRYESTASMWAVTRRLPPLLDFLEHPGRPISSRAAAGLLKRITNGSTNVPDVFLDDLKVIAEGEKLRLAKAGCRALEQEVERLRNAIRRETQFAVKVELSAQVSALEAHLAEAQHDLRKLQGQRS